MDVHRDACYILQLGIDSQLSAEHAAKVRGCVWGWVRG